MPMTAISAEWRAYQSLRKPLLAFFSPDEIETIRLGLL